MQAQPDDEDFQRSCTFFMLNADFVRSFSGKSLPFFQEIRDQFKANKPLVEVSLDYADVVNGKHLETTLAVSHRWMQPNDPDPDGEQLKALKDFLDSPDGKKIEHVWIDSACMPQDHPKGSRSAEDTAVFKKMLKEVNRLYLGTTVLVLLDLSYNNRFWTQFESWLAMQYAMPDGLKPAVGTMNARHHIKCIHAAVGQAEQHSQVLVDQWANKTPDEVHAFLSSPDIEVTNQSDKEGQLPKIKALNATVQGAFGDVARQLEEELAASNETAARAEAALSAWETAHGAKADEGNQLLVAARQAASAAAAARDAKEEHAQAISSGVVPAIMKAQAIMRGGSTAVGSLSCGWFAGLVTSAQVCFANASGVAPLVALVRDGTDAQKEAAAAALANRAANNAVNAVEIVRAGGVAPLVALVRDGMGGQKQAAAGALGNLAGNADNQVAITKAGGVAPLVALARGGTNGEKEAAAKALGQLALKADNKAIAKAGGIAPLVALVRDGTGGQKFESSLALAALAAHDNADNQAAIAKAGGIAPLVALARGGTDEQKGAATVALGNLAATCGKNRAAIAKAGGIAPLVALACGGTDDQKELAARVLSHLSVNDNNKVAIAKAGGIAPLVALARSGTDAQKEAAAGTLYGLSVNADNKVAIAKAGGVAPLVALARDGTEGQKVWAAWALASLAYEDVDNKVAVAKAAGIAPLVALVRGGTDEQKDAAAAALRELATNADNQLAVALAGGIAPLVKLARDGTGGQKEKAAAVLWHLSNDKTNLAAMNDLGYGWTDMGWAAVGLQ